MQGLGVYFSLLGFALFGILPCRDQESTEDLAPQLPNECGLSRQLGVGQGRSSGKECPRSQWGERKGRPMLALLHYLLGNDLAAFLLVPDFAISSWQKGQGCHGKLPASSIHDASRFSASHRASVTPSSCPRFPWLRDGGHPSGNLQGELRLGGNDGEPYCSKNTQQKRKCVYQPMLVERLKR